PPWTAVGPGRAGAARRDLPGRAASAPPLLQEGQHAVVGTAAAPVVGGRRLVPAAAVQDAVGLLGAVQAADLQELARVDHHAVAGIVAIGQAQLFGVGRLDVG